MNSQETGRASSVAVPSNRLRRHPIATGLAGGLLVLIVAIAFCEWWGWPFLAGPLQRALSSALERPVMLASRTGPSPASASASAPAVDSDAGTRIRFFGGLTLRSPRLEIGAPAWSRAAHMLVVERGSVDLRYIDLWRARNGGPLRIKRLQAERLDAILERRADGRASWQFASKPKDKTDVSEDHAVPRFDRLEVDEATFHYADEPLKADVKGRFSLREGGASAPTTGAESAEKAPGGLRADASGTYKGHPLKVTLRSVGVLPWIADETAAALHPLTVDVHAGPARFSFDGAATDLPTLSGLGGKVLLSGPSLAAVGDLFGVTLPTTNAFRAVGVLQKEKQTWNVRVDEAAIGASRLHAALRYDAGRKVPLLAGRVGGSKLALVDLGPTIGTESKAAGQPAPTPRAATDHRVLPAREFDLPSLRAMDANVLLDFAELDLNTDRVEPLRPLRGHLLLRAGVLEIDDIEARTADGRLHGMVGLDGTASRAIWRTDLGWEGVRLERWLHQKREGGAPPYITGELQGTAKLEGRGRSTAEILGDMQGRVRTELRNGTISHLIVEAAGLDIAQGLGMLVRGDDALKVTCGLADLQATKGVLRPRAMVIDTSDSVVWVDGTVSMADEALDLRAVVTPKDFSPMTLRTPLLVKGMLAAPKVSLQAQPLVPKIGASILLGLLNPLAALLPLIDTGGAKDFGEAGCQQLLRRAALATGKLPSDARVR